MPCFFIAGPAGGKDQVLQFARLSQPCLPAARSRMTCFERGKALLDVQVAGVHQDGVLGPAQRGGGAVGVLVVPAADVGQHGVVVGRLALGDQLGVTAVGAGFGAGGQKDLDVWRRAAPRCRCPGRPSARCGFWPAAAGCPAGRPAPPGWPPTAEAAMPTCSCRMASETSSPLSSTCCAPSCSRMSRLHLRQQRRNGGVVRRVFAGAQRIQADSPVHSAGVHIGIAQLGGQTPRHAGFPCPGGPVDGNRDHVCSFADNQELTIRNEELRCGLRPRIGDIRFSGWCSRPMIASARTPGGGLPLLGCRPSALPCRAGVSRPPGGLRQAAGSRPGEIARPCKSTEAPDDRFPGA